MPANVLACDALLLRLAAARQSLAEPLARAAALVVAHQSWLHCGYRTQGDFTREELHRDARWLRETYPQLKKVGIISPNDAVGQTLAPLHAQAYTQLPAGQRFAAIALGKATPSTLHFDAWKAQLTLATKTQDQMKKDVALLVARFSTLEEITQQAVKAWLTELEAKGFSESSRIRIVSFCRNYWGYLQDAEATALLAQCMEVQKLLTVRMRSLGEGKTYAVREEPEADYRV